MFTKRTIIGIVVGAAIIGIGGYALATSFGLQSINLTETIPTGSSLPYTITAPASTPQSMVITGEKFELSLTSPKQEGASTGDDNDNIMDDTSLQIPSTIYTKQLTLDWTHAADGQTKIRIKNVGSDELVVDSTLLVSTDPILFAYHFIVITAGVIIIGFSLGFSIRKPKGF